MLLKQAKLSAAQAPLQILRHEDLWLADWTESGI